MKNMAQPVLKSGLGLMLLSALTFAFADILTKYLSYLFSPVQIAFVRFLFGGLLLWPILSFKGISLRGNQTRILILRGLFGTLSFFCLLKSIAMIPLADAIVLLYTFPLFAFLFSFLFLKTGVEVIEILVIGTGLLGVYVFINPDFHSFNVGYVYGLFSGCSGGMAMLSIYKARQTNGPLIIYFYFCLVGGVISFPFWVHGFKVPEAQHAISLFVLALLLLIGQVLMNQGFKYCKAAQGSLILMSEVLFTGMAGVLLFKEPVTYHFLAGGFLIIGSGVGLNLISRLSKHSSTS
ncbi:MAG: DMT family transporter [Thermodesulfobacteriota bacterium]